MGYTQHVSNEVPLDLISRVRRDWQTTLPDLDTSSLEIIGRIGRIDSLANGLLDRTLSESHISRSEFTLLCTLARAPRPLRASEITEQTMRSSAATTKLTVRLEQFGYLQREKFDRDGRVALFSLTPQGRQLVEDQFPACMEQERQLLSGLSDEEADILADLLSRVLASAESEQLH